MATKKHRFTIKKVSRGGYWIRDALDNNKMHSGPYYFEEEVKAKVKELNKKHGNPSLIKRKWIKVKAIRIVGKTLQILK